MTDEATLARWREQKRRHRARQRGEIEPFRTFASDIGSHVRAVTNEDGTVCVEWTGALNDHGYPIVRFHGRLVLVTRLVLARKLQRPLAPGMKACHTCDNPPCINPDHLFEGTHDENMADMIAKGRSRNGASRSPDVDERSAAEQAAERYARHRR